ncbi:MAG: DUF4150 domain-containing protein [Planctomycetes bacterium]|nr:DUF4150 domain-containing protein [Planctomycetota bacterium]
MFAIMTQAGGTCMAFPDACKTPMPAPVPIPYPDIAQVSDASDGADTVKVADSKVVRKGDKISSSNGDNAGVLNGLVSNKFMGKCEVKVGWPTVKAKDKEVGFHTTGIGQNGEGSVNAVGLNAAPSQGKAYAQVSPGMLLAQGPQPKEGPKLGEWNWESVSKEDQEKTKNEFGDDCQGENGKSESYDTASDDVKKHCRDTDKRGPSAWDGKLGKNGGGGFVEGSAKVEVIPKGTIVYRWFGGASSPMGGWWFKHPIQDPIRDAALPEGTTADHMVPAELKQDMEAVTGPGAPRCTNKPGGPSQICFPRPPGGKWEEVLKVRTI